MRTRGQSIDGSAMKGKGSLMTNTNDALAGVARGDRTNGDAASASAIAAMRIPELQALANQLGVKTTSKMRKGDLVDAIAGAAGA